MTTFSVWTTSHVCCWCAWVHTLAHLWHVAWAVLPSLSPKGSDKWQSPPLSSSVNIRTNISRRYKTHRSKWQTEEVPLTGQFGLPDGIVFWELHSICPGYSRNHRIFGVVGTFKGHNVKVLERKLLRKECVTLAGKETTTPRGAWVNVTY